MAFKIDEIDRKILETLRENASISNERLGKKVGLSEPATRRRVSNLVSRGVIRRFTIDVEEGGAVQALIFLSTSSQTSSEKLAKLLEKEKGIGAIWEISGDNDVAITLSAPDMAALNKQIDEIRSFEAIKKTQTNIILKKWR